jgi:hypothetical protein
MSDTNDILAQLKDVRENLSHGNSYTELGAALYAVVEAVIDGAITAVQAVINAHDHIDRIAKAKG